jgi:hypothetical protein
MRCISEQQAVQVGREFLDGIGCTTGKVLSVKLETKNPNFYWHDLAELERPDIEGLMLCWVIRFEQAHRVVTQPETPEIELLWMARSTLCS